MKKKLLSRFAGQRRSMFGRGIAVLMVLVMFPAIAAAQSYDRWSIDQAHQHMNTAYGIMASTGWQHCYYAQQACQQVEWHLGQASEHIMTVFNTVIASRDSNGACLLMDPSTAHGAAVRLKAFGESLSTYGGRYYWGHSADTISGWLTDPPCMFGPGPGPPPPAPTPVPPPPPVPWPVPPGPERCADPSIPSDASLTGYNRLYGGGHSSIPMKGEFACTGPGRFMRVTRSEFTEYQCEADYTNCRQTKVTPIVRTEVKEGSTVYWVSSDSWWVKKLR